MFFKLSPQLRYKLKKALEDQPGSTWTYIREEITKIISNIFPWKMGWFLTISSYS